MKGMLGHQSLHEILKGRMILAILDDLFQESQVSHHQLSVPVLHARHVLPQGVSFLRPSRSCVRVSYFIQHWTNFSHSTSQQRPDDGMRKTQPSAPSAPLEPNLVDSIENNSADDESQRRTLFLGDLDRSTTHEDIVNLFSSYGEVCQSSSPPLSSVA